MKSSIYALILSTICLSTAVLIENSPVMVKGLIDHSILFVGVAILCEAIENK